MSKKNNQEEKDVADKRKAKQEHKAVRVAAADRLGVQAPKSLKRKQKKGVRIKKHVVVRGIKITDAESKRKAKQLLAAEEAMKAMMMDTEGEQQGQQGGGDQAMRATSGGGRKDKRVGTGGGARLKGGSSVKVKAKREKKGAAGSGVGMSVD